MPLQAPDATHVVALVETQVNVLLAPLLTVVGAADSDTVGTGGGGFVTVTDVLAAAVPPVPEQLSVNVASAFNAPVLSLPETAFAPLQAPVAVHDVALVDDHVNVLLAPLLTVVGAADSATVGAGAGPPPPEELPPPPPPPHAARVKASASQRNLDVDLMAAIIGNRGGCREMPCLHNHLKLRNTLVESESLRVATAVPARNHARKAKQMNGCRYWQMANR